MSKRAVIYGRVSTDMQRDNYSIPSQVAECLKYVKQRGYSLVGDQYVDPNSGHDTVGGNGAVPAYIDDFSSRELSRPSINTALTYLERVGYDVLVVHALDRLARDRVHSNVANPVAGAECRRRRAAGLVSNNNLDV